MDKSELIEKFMSNNILIDNDGLSFLCSTNYNINNFISACIAADNLFLDKNSVEDFLKTLDEKDKKQEQKTTIQPSISKPSTHNRSKDYDSSVIVHSIPEDNTIPKPKNVNSFSGYFADRYEKIKNILFNRPSLKGSRSLNSITQTTNDRNVSVIVMINSVGTSKNGHTILEIEDMTAQLTAIIMKGKLIGQNMLIADEVVGLIGSLSNGTLFVNDIIFPGIPKTFRKNHITDPLRAVFISDLHIGSNEYLPKVEERFLKWVNGTSKDASEIKYICIAGDVVDGVGIYPDQKDDLKIKNIFDQYNTFETFIEKIPDHIQIVICPGNHDAVRQAEPQPPFDSHYFPTISKFRNVHLVQNPCSLSLHSFDNNPGINVLMYHGYSFTSLNNAVPDLRKHGISNPKFLLKELIRKRHLAPLFGSTIITPKSSDDLVINSIPDILHTGDLHGFCIDSYENKIDLFSTSTFQGQTSFMDRVGHTANPGKVIHENLMTRQIGYETFY